MIRLAYFTLDDIRYPCPVIRVFEPNRLLHPQVQLLNALTVVNGQRYENPAALDEADVVLVQRGFPRRETQPLCERILACGKPVIYETDDALQLVPKEQSKPHYATDVTPAVEKFAQQADLVTVATAPIGELFARLARRVAVIPNALSPDLWTDRLVAVPREARRLRVGFVGGPHHSRDLLLLAPLLREALDRYPDLEVVTYGGASAGLEDHARFSAIKPYYDYASHPQRLAAAAIDIAVAPLTPSRFNRCKSNIKFLEFGFLGVPGVFAALDPYRDVVHGETGFVCDARPATWRDALFRLIEDADLRRRVGQAAREAVRSRWMLDAHKDKWLQAYDLAAQVRAGRQQKAKGKGAK